MNARVGVCVVVLGMMTACGGTPYANPAETEKSESDKVGLSVSTPDAAATVAPVQSAESNVANALGKAIWRLVDARDAKGARIAAIRAKPGIPLSLVFANGRVQVRNACNHMGGDYLVGAGGAFAIDKLQRTERICPDKAEMAAEDTLYAVLEVASSIELSKNGSRLQLGDEAGNILSFEAIPVPQR